MGSIYGYEVESGLQLRRMREELGVRGRLRLEAVAERLLDRSGELTAWLDWPGTGHHFAMARSNGLLLASWSDLGTFEVDPGALRIRAEGSGFDPLGEHRLATTVIPLLLAERGDLALHGAVVAAHGRGVLFCGPSGRGKSTLALLASQLGHAVLSEDGAVIEPGKEGKVWPGPCGVFVEDELTIAARARAAEASNGATVTVPRRRRLRMLEEESHDCSAVPVAAICQMAERGADLTVARLSPAEAIPGLVPDLIHAGGPDSLRPAFALLADLLQRVPAYRVSMPEGIQRAREATRALLDQVTE
jgi:hypothetical protein